MNAHDVGIEKMPTIYGFAQGPGQQKSGMNKSIP